MDDYEIITRDMIIEFRKSVPEKQSAIWTKDEKRKLSRCMRRVIPSPRLQCGSGTVNRQRRNSLIIWASAMRARGTEARTRYAASATSVSFIMQGFVRGERGYAKKKPLPSKQGYPSAGQNGQLPVDADKHFGDGE